MARKSAQVETRMLSEYLLAEYPQYPHRQSVPLGVIDAGLQAQVGYKAAVGYSRPYRPEVDGVVFLPGALVLVEAKVWNVINGLAKLPLYNSLIPATPELKEYNHLPVIMELVVGGSNKNLEIMAAERGVRIRVYSPPWLADVYAKMQSYWTADYQRERQRKLEVRKILGLE